MQIVIFSSYLLFLVIEIVLNRRFRSNNTDKKDADKKSILILWITICCSLFLAGFIAGRFSLPVYANALGLYISLALLYCGIVLRLFAVYTLGKFFTVDVTIRNDHRLKTDGLYKYIRHPNYLALLLCFFAIALSFNNWLALLIVVVPVSIAFINRINVEEKVLKQHFGDAYLNYTKSTKRLIPYIY